MRTSSPPSSLIRAHNDCNVVSVHGLGCKHDWDVQGHPGVQQNATGPLHEQAEVLRWAAPLEIHSEVCGGVQRVGEGEDVGGVGVQAGLDGGGSHRGGLQAPPFQDEHLGPKLQEWGSTLIITACSNIRNTQHSL